MKNSNGYTHIFEVELFIDAESYALRCRLKPEVDMAAAKPEIIIS